MRASALFSLLAAVSLALAAASTPVLASPDLYNSTLALRLLHLAGAAYCPASTVLPWTCGFCTEAADFLPWGVSTNDTTNQLAFAGYDTLSGTITVVFRGTALLSILDWVENLDFTQTPAICDGCQVHKGFLGDYMSIRDDLLQTTRSLIGAYPDAPIVITGHSLGGALTELAAIDFALNEQIVANTIYTFGAPRVGNDVWVQNWQTLFWDTTAYRVTHCMDPVPHAPPQAMGFVHPPTEVYYNEDNSQFTVCEGGEDPSCADQWLLPVNALDHGTYLGFNFLGEFAKCTF
jgi:hypothetical protein